MEFVNPRKQAFVKPASRGQLPHLYKPNGTYFITTRLFDAVVNGKSAAIDFDREDIEPEELMRDFDPPITLGSCALRRPEISGMAQDALLFFNKVRYELIAWCIMSNHAHIVLQANEPWNPSQIMKGWKGFTAREANKILGTRGSFWEAESFDHLIRRPGAVVKFVNYTERNPIEAGLCKRVEDWPFSSVQHFGVRQMM